MSIAFNCRLTGRLSLLHAVWEGSAVLLDYPVSNENHMQHFISGNKIHLQLPRVFYARRVSGPERRGSCTCSKTVLRNDGMLSDCSAEPHDGNEGCLIWHVLPKIKLHELEHTELPNLKHPSRGKPVKGNALTAIFLMRVNSVIITTRSAKPA